MDADDDDTTCEADAAIDGSHRHQRVLLLTIGPLPPTCTPACILESDCVRLYLYGGAKSEAEIAQSPGYGHGHGEGSVGGEVVDHEHVLRVRLPCAVDVASARPAKWSRRSRRLWLRLVPLP